MTRTAHCLQVSSDALLVPLQLILDAGELRSRRLTAGRRSRSLERRQLLPGGSGAATLQRRELRAAADKLCHRRGKPLRRRSLLECATLRAGADDSESTRAVDATRAPE